MALDADSLLVASFTNDVILRINLTNGELINKIGSEDTLDCPEGIAFSPDGRLFVASFLLPHLSVFDPESGAFLGRFGSSLQPALPTAAPPLFGLGKHEGPRGAEDLAFDLDGNVHVTGYYSNAVFKFNGTSGALELTYGRGLVHGPVGVVCDDLSGDLFIASYKDHQVLRFSSAGQFVGVAAGADSERRQRSRRGRSISSPSGLAFASDGTLWVASYTTGAVTRFNNSVAGGRTFWRVTE